MFLCPLDLKPSGYPINIRHEDSRSFKMVLKKVEYMVLKKVKDILLGGLKKCKYGLEKVEYVLKMASNKVKGGLLKVKDGLE